MLFLKKVTDIVFDTVGNRGVKGLKGFLAHRGQTVVGAVIFLCDRNKLGIQQIRNGGLDGEICRIAFVQEKFTELGIRQWKFGMVQNI